MIEDLLTRAGRAVSAPPEGDGFAERASAEGLVDVAYAIEGSPVGELLLAVTPRGLVNVLYLDHVPLERALERLSERVSPRVLEAPARVDPVRRQLGDYFDGRRRGFDLDVDWALAGGPFGRQVLERCAAIPYGEVSTYGTIARDIGSPRAARAAGNALGANPLPIVVPCHRVLRGGGKMGGYTGGTHRKEHLLALEGVAPPGR